MIRRRPTLLAVWSQPLQPSCRPFHVATYLRSGHNRWSKIKHDKGVKDGRKSKERGGLVNAVIRASKDGGPDTKLNPTLAFAIANAKRAQVSKEAIDKAIAKGQGKSVSGVELDPVFLEAMLPHGVAVVMEGQTDNKKRILADVKMIVQRSGGSFAPAIFSFEKKGKIWFKPHETIGLEEAMDQAIDAGAEEITEEENQLIVETAPEMLSVVAQAMQTSLNIEVDKSQLIYDPKEETMVRLNEEQATEIQSVMDQLEDLDDLQEVYINATI